MIFAKPLARKVVISLDGTVIGTVYNMTMDFSTGTLVNLIVKPENKYLKLDMQEGYYIIPFEEVKSIEDYVVVNRSKIRSEAL